MTYMDASDYKGRRDRFTKALLSLRDSELEFIESVDNWDGVNNELDLAARLDEEGKVLTGEEYLALKESIARMEMLVGRAHASAANLLEEIK